MKALHGNIRWVTKRTMWISVCVVCMIAFCILYSRYISGSIQIDTELIGQDNFDKISLNWRKLKETGLFIELDLNESNTHLLQYAHPKLSADGYDMAFYIVVQDDPQISHSEMKGLNLHASYQRTGIVDAIYGCGRFGECTSRFSVGNGQCSIFAIFYDSSGTSDEFDKLMCEILNAVD